MTSALVYKELRETVGIALLGLAVLLLVALANIGWNPLQGLGGGARGYAIPFVGDSFQVHFGMAAFGLATVLGFRQAIGDFSGDAQLFLLHRPISRRRIYGTKLVVGLAIYLVCSGVSILLYAWWAALPGTHASPFEWSMTAGTWIVWFAITAVYLGAFLSGIRPAAWFGTRLAPLAGTLVPLVVVSVSPLVISFATPFALLVLAAADALLVMLILFIVETRDFA